MTLAGGLNPFGLSELEIACGLVYGSEPRREPEWPPNGASPLQALEEAILPALIRSPCVVSFSGGRDSSAVLAAAVAVARREGLALPIPATNVFPDAPSSAEGEWQERVVRHLGLADWLRLEHDDELDVVGPVAAGLMRRHGLLWPCNVHFHGPIVEAATGGSLLTGIGGDEVFGRSRWARAASVLSGRARPVPRDLLRLGLRLAPSRTRAAFLRKRHQPRFPWLREDARQTAIALWARQAAAEPLAFTARLGWWRRLRYLAVGLAGIGIVAGERSVRAFHPFSAPAFLAALGRLGGFAGFRSRDDAMRAVLGDLLPDALYARSTKVHFDEAFWRGHSRGFAASWEGQGVDEEIVDVGALRAEWASPAPDGHTFTLLQRVWLTQEAQGPSASDRLEQAAGSIVH